MDNQDIMQLLHTLEDRIETEDNDMTTIIPLGFTGKERLILFFALQHYLTHLTNNKGHINRIIETTKLIEILLPDVKDYALNFLQEIKQWHFKNY